LIHKFDSVLLVDDDEISNILTKALFEDLNIGKEVVSFANPKEALDYVKTVKLMDPNSSHLMILDLNMPEMSGEEFLCAFQNLPIINKDRIKIILLSALLPATRYNYMRGLGVDEFMEKPLADTKITMLLAKLGISDKV
jgi:CheY-like chemotaxis protein